MIIQWGISGNTTSGQSSQEVSVTFGLSFTNDNSVKIITTPQVTGSDNYQQCFVIKSLSRTGATFRNENRLSAVQSSFAFDWLAIGY